MMKRFHIRAHGSTEHPDLDCEVDEVSWEQLSGYPVVSIDCLHVLPLSAYVPERKRPSSKNGYGYGCSPKPVA